MRILTPAVLALALVATACSKEETKPAPAATAAAPSAQMPVAQLPRVDQAKVLDHIKTLSADDMEGRAPGSKGEDKAVAYIESQFKAIGLQPGNPDGTYIQKVPLVGITGVDRQPLTFTKGSRRVEVKWKDDVVAWSRHMAPLASVQDSDVIFAGYGVDAPEYNWNDFKNVDVKGKTIVVLVNDPQIPDPSNPAALDPKMFNGKAMTYYGRWTYKFEEGARKGAAAVLIVHDAATAGYPFGVVQGNLGEKFTLGAPDKNMSEATIEGWITTGAAKKLMALSGQDFDSLKKQALSRDFKPVPLGVTASITVANTLRTIESRNVAARLDGSDPRLASEYVVYSAHWDHLGVGEPVKGDRIYNGAIDNASGVATVLEIARALKQAPPAKRSFLFLMVTAEEQGLLGSEYYSLNPLYRLARTAADINVDEINPWGRTKALSLVGLGASDLDDYLRDALQEQGRTMTGDPEPEKGFYYRSDHFNFAKQGVPALDPSMHPGVDFVDKPADWVARMKDEWDNQLYHSPLDQVQPDWNFAGAAEDAQALMAVGYRVANAATLPAWKPGNEFKAKRDAMMK
ncbi:MAG TPA: M28 family peptidase [Vicinamibacterales bacterium]